MEAGDYVAYTLDGVSALVARVTEVWDNGDICTDTDGAIGFGRYCKIQNPRSFVSRDQAETLMRAGFNEYCCGRFLGHIAWAGCVHPNDLENVIPAPTVIQAVRFAAKGGFGMVGALFANH